MVISTFIHFFNFILYLSGNLKHLSRKTTLQHSPKPGIRDGQ